MSDSVVYTFKIKDFTPKTMPFERLVQYYVQLKRMLDIADNMHLLEITEASHGSCFAIDRGYETRVQKRLEEVRVGEAPKTNIRAYETINKMLQDDGTSGSFSQSNGADILQFPGRATASDVNLSVRVKDTASFYGFLYHLSGAQDDVKVRIETAQYGKIYCVATRELAKNLRNWLLEDIKVSGRGTWVRDSNGIWSIEDFTITDFTPVLKENLKSAIERIKSVGIDWPEDTVGNIYSLNEKNGATS